MSDAKINVNGITKEIPTTGTIDYATAIGLAGKSGDHFTVVCCYRELQARSLRPGQQVPLEDGMFIEVAFTGNA